jgi:P4 family phage/plasmid primase-like protien
MSLEKLNQELKAIGIDEIKDVDADPCPERTRYFTFKNEANYDDKNWVKKLKSISDTYFINFYKRVAYLYPHLKYEIGRLDSFWNYDDKEGVYYEIEQPTLSGIIIRALREDEMDSYTTDSQVKRIILNFTADPSRGVTLDDFVVTNGWLHVANGWLQLDTKELQPHSPERLSLTKMDTTFNPVATSPEFDKFLDIDTQMSSDQIRVIDQFSGYILTNGIEQHSCLIIEGRKGAGKSMLVEIWMNILGQKGVTLQLKNIQNNNEKFIGETLSHKNLCWFDEANPRTADINEFFQTLITGETIRVERKGVQKSKFVKNTLKIVLTLNEMPDHMPTGMDRRYRHIIFTRSFYEEGIMDPDYKKRILENEKSGVLNRMLRGYDDFKKMGRLTTIDGEEERKREYTLTADDFSSFLSDHFNPTPVNEGIVRYSYEELRNAFVAEYPKNYHQQLTVRGFNKKLLATRLPEYGHLQKGKSDGARGYKGIELKKGHELPNNDTSPIRVGIQGIDDF